MGITWRLLALTSVATLTMSCPMWDTTPADILWVPANAMLERDLLRPVAVRHRRSVYRDGSAAVGFTVTADRDELSDQATAYFKERGWRQRRTQYLNPQVPTSFHSGWRLQCSCTFMTDVKDNRVTPESLHLWEGEWENDRGDVVTYLFVAEGRRMRGYASCDPSRIVELRAWTPSRPMGLWPQALRHADVPRRADAA
jgi:hypothetical protein